MLTHYFHTLGLIRDKNNKNKTADKVFYEQMAIHTLKSINTPDPSSLGSFLLNP